MMQKTTDTIAAISTAPGKAAISIVRLSGPESLRIADQLFRSPGPPPSARPRNTFVLGHFFATPTEQREPADRPIDEVILLLFRAPHSYTREDLVEIQCHGGHISARAILDAIISSGARLAEPGEFTRRAFLAGRLDLTQAEAVMDLIQAQTSQAASLAVRHLHGSLSSAISATYALVMNLASELEASLDFADEEIPDPDNANALRILSNASADLTRVLESARHGEILRDGARVVIAGRPNSGKSTLFNLMCGADRAIVTHEPGTTRDTVTATVDLDGYPITIVDTAGIRPPTSDPERLGIERTRHEVAAADILIYMIDASTDIHADDVQTLQTVRPDNCLLVFNKTDLGRNCLPPNGFRDPMWLTLLPPADARPISERILSMLDGNPAHMGQYAVSKRQSLLIRDAVRSVDHAHSRLAARSGAEQIAADLRAALESLGMLTGRSYDDELLETVFARFCIGK